MLRNILKAFSFITILIFLFIVLSYVLRTGNETTNMSWNIKSYYMLPSNTVDVVYFVRYL